MKTFEQQPPPPPYLEIADSRLDHLSLLHFVRHQVFKSQNSAQVVHQLTGNGTLVECPGAFGSYHLQVLHHGLVQRDVVQDGALVQKLAAVGSAVDELPGKTGRRSVQAINGD